MRPEGNTLGAQNQKNNAQNPGFAVLLNYAAFRFRRGDTQKAKGPMAPVLPGEDSTSVSLAQPFQPTTGFDHVFPVTEGGKADEAFARRSEAGTGRRDDVASVQNLSEHIPA